jgi:CDP-diacylglycerol--glycerol-3-phosphate 3-phosphatidyltransferase
MKVNLPNQITLARLLLAVVFFVLLAQFDLRQGLRGQVWLLDACVALFVVAAATDWLDGFLARRRNMVTAFGRVLDPFVDKVLVCGTFVFLAGPGFRNGANEQVTFMAPWMVVVILGRELLVTGLRGFSESAGQAFGANFYGKAKMVVQSITAPVLLFFVAHVDRLSYGPSLEPVKIILVWTTVLITMFSMATYLYQARRVLAGAAAS